MLFCKDSGPHVSQACCTNPHPNDESKPNHVQTKVDIDAGTACQIIEPAWPMFLPSSRPCIFRWLIPTIPICFSALYAKHCLKLGCETPWLFSLYQLSALTEVFGGPKRGPPLETCGKRTATRRGLGDDVLDGSAATRTTFRIAIAIGVPH